MTFTYDSILFNRGPHIQHRIWNASGRIVEQAVCATGGKRDLTTKQQFETRVKELNQQPAPVPA